MNLNDDQHFTQQEKLWYAMTQLSDKVKNQVLLYCLNNTVNLPDLITFEKLMRTSFEDSDWQGTAEITIYGVMMPDLINLGRQSRAALLAWRAT